MTEQEAIKLFEKAHFLKEKLDMQDDINDINEILTYPVDVAKVYEKIEHINRKHPENIILFNIIYPPVGKPIPLNRATNDNLINDLIWKREFLNAKMNAKLFDEFCKEMKKRSKSDGQDENANA